jgi:hypothetical protein
MLIITKVVLVLYYNNIFFNNNNNFLFNFNYIYTLLGYITKSTLTRNKDRIYNIEFEDGIKLVGVQEV